MALRAFWARDVVIAPQSGMIAPPGNATAGQPAASAREVGVIIVHAPSSRSQVNLQPAQQESCVTSLEKVWAASFRPSTMVR